MLRLVAALSVIAMLGACAPSVDPTNQADVSQAIEVVEDSSLGTTTLVAPQVSKGGFGDKTAWIEAERGSKGSWDTFRLKSRVCCNPSKIGVVLLNDARLPFTIERINQSISNVSFIGSTPIVTNTPVNVSIVTAAIDRSMVETGVEAGLRLLVWDTGNNLRHLMVLPPAYMKAFRDRLAETAG